MIGYLRLQELFNKGKPIVKSTIAVKDHNNRFFYQFISSV